MKYQQIFKKVNKKVKIREYGFIRGMRINLDSQGEPILKNDPKGEYVIEETYEGIECRDIVELSKLNGITSSTIADTE